MTNSSIDNWTLSAGDIASKISQGEITYTQVIEWFRNRIEGTEPNINAIAALSNQAMQIAAARDAVPEEKRKAGLLEGVPVLVKDNIDTSGIPTRNGSKLQEGRVPDEDDLPVQRLREAGAIILGKTNTSEFAHDVDTTNFLQGRTRNPWHGEYSPGGSSGGSGAAVAAGMAPIALGTDFGGSIRIPAAYNGIVGIRPTTGRVPILARPFAWDLLVSNVVGPMAFTVRDTALALDVMAGASLSEPNSRHTIPGCTSAVDAVKENGLSNRFKIGYLADIRPLRETSDQVQQLMDGAVENFIKLGHEVEQITLDCSHLLEIIKGTRAFGVLARFQDCTDQQLDQMTEVLRNQILQARNTSLLEVVNAERLRGIYWQQIADIFSEYDAILMPTCPEPPVSFEKIDTFKAKGGSLLLDTAIYTYVFSVIGVPVLNLPCGWTDAGLPIGLQLVGPPEKESLLFSLGALYESHYPEFFRRPEL